MFYRATNLLRFKIESPVPQFHIACQLQDSVLEEKFNRLSGRCVPPMDGFQVTVREHVGL
jgi:hypothetical protein